MASILAGKIPWTEESGGLQSTGLQRVRQLSPSTGNYGQYFNKRTNKSHCKKVTFNSEILGLNHMLPIYFKIRTNTTNPNICLFKSRICNVTVHSVQCPAD